MGTDYKSVRLTESAYEELERRKRPDESFSEAVRRLARERPIADLAGAFSADEVSAIRDARGTGYEEYGRKREAATDRADRSDADQSVGEEGNTEERGDEGRADE